LWKLEFGLELNGIQVSGPTAARAKRVPETALDGRWADRKELEQEYERDFAAVVAG
jgi:hypothetical protein